MTDKIKLLEEIIESCTDKYGDNRNEIAKALFLLNEIKEAINYTRCCTEFYCYNKKIDSKKCKNQCMGCEYYEESKSK
jgi:predicted house-cleaning noncanonical NTP pyrophosphatase (MazG superfamily)